MFSTSKPRTLTRIAIAGAFATVALSALAIPASAEPAAPNATAIGQYDDCEPTAPCWADSLNNPANPLSPLNLNHPANPASALSPLNPYNPANPNHPYQQPTT
ncbi:hypothetical protein ACWDYH_09990 [Nocardia goodfellowii]